MEDHYQGGNGQAYRVDDYGMEILNRQYELEREGLGVSESSSKVINEQKNRDNGKDNEAKVGQDSLKVQLKALERENELLRDRLTRQDKQIERFHDRIDNLPPGEVEENGNKDDFKEFSLIEAVKKWFTTKI